MIRRAAPVLVLSLLVAGDAAAYCRSSVCQVEGGKSVQGKVCVPAEIDDCGKVLSWPQPCVGFAVHEKASRQVDLATARQIMAEAFAPWTQADCGGGARPAIEVDDLGVVACGKLEYNQHGGNASILIFHDDTWPHENADGSTDTIALTTVTYDVDKGSIFDADIEVNGVQNTFTTTDDPTKVQVDLLSVLTHEAGHFLGLGHSDVAGEEPNVIATMTPIYPGGLDLRDLAVDDVAGICDVYPPGRKGEGQCTGIPRHGFSPECLEEQTEGTCAAAPGRGSGGDPGGFVGVLMLAIAMGLRRAAARRA